MHILRERERDGGEEEGQNFKKPLLNYNLECKNYNLA